MCNLKIFVFFKVTAIILPEPYLVLAIFMEHIALNDILSISYKTQISKKESKNS